MNFWDSSALLPLLVEETGTQDMQAFYRRQPEIVAAWNTYVECTSALARLEREGRLESKSVTQAIRQLQSLQSAWHEVQPTEPVRQVACRLLRVHPLRAADALQLASALVAAGNRIQEWGFICQDAKLSDAAEREGFRMLGDFDN